MVLQLRRAMFILAICLAAFDTIHAQEREPQVDRTPVLEEFDIPTDGDAMLVPVTLAKNSCLFMVDTGASWTTFDTSLRPLLQPPVEKARVNTPGGPVETNFHPFPEIHVGSMPVAAKGVVASFPLEDMRKAAGANLFGILGMDVLSQYVVRLDFDRGKLVFLKEADPNDGMRLSFLHPRAPVIHVGFPGMYPSPFLIDTGDITLCSGMLNSSLVSWMEENDLLTTIGKAKYSDASGTRWVREGLIDRCSFGAHRCTNTIWSDGSNDVPNHVSLYFLTQFNITFDFPNAVMYVTKSKHFGHENLVDLSGLHFRRTDGQVIIEAVDNGSMAEKCGIEAGDAIKSIDGDDASQARLFAVRKALSQPGRKVSLVIARGSETFERELTLRAKILTQKRGSPSP